MPDSEFRPRVLLVEGQDDKHVTRHIITRRGLNIGIDIDRDIEVTTSVDSLIDSIRSTVDAPRREVVGILADANDHPNRRWQSITDRLRKSNGLRGASLPPRPEPTGTIIPGGPRRPRVGIWLMPDNQSPGEIEDFVAGMIPRDDPIWPRAEAYINEIVRDFPKPPRKFTEKKAQRAKVHTWLAARENPRQMGVAIGAHDLGVDVPLCQSFTDWLWRLFAP